MERPARFVPDDGPFIIFHSLGYPVPSGPPVSGAMSFRSANVFVGSASLVIWRSVVVAVYIGIPLAGYFAWGGIGWAWLILFAVWGLVWLGFSVFWSWALRVRRTLLHREESS